MFKKLLLGLFNLFLFCGVATADIDYLAGGMPKAENVWQPADYLQAYSLLAKEKLPLPQATSKDSAKFFERMVNEENLKQLEDKSVVFAVRMQNYFAIQDQANNLLKLYLSAHNEGRVKAPYELVRLMSFLLHLGTIGINLTNEFLPQIPRDESYEVRLEGIKRMRAGLGRIFAGLEQSLSEKNVYGPDDLSLLLQAMKRELPHYLPMFETGFSGVLVKKLQVRAQDFSRPEDTQALQFMIQELEKADKGEREKTKAESKEKGKA